MILRTIFTTTFVTLIGLTAFSNVHNPNSYVDMQQALLGPHKIEALELDLTLDEEIHKFYDNVSSFKTLKAIRVTDYDTKGDLAAFCRIAAQLKTVERLELPTNEITTLPRDLNRFESLTEIHLVGTEELGTWVPSEAVLIDYVRDASLKKDVKMIVYNTEELEDNALSKLVRMYPDALIDPVVEVDNDFVYMPGKFKSVRPPLKGVDVEREKYTVNAEAGAKLYYKSGTIVHVPTDAFVDKDGQVIEGEVKIEYREFADPAEIFASGIPMNYDSAGQRGWFTSAGMFEMSASYEGEEVFVNPNKTIDVSLVTTDTDTDFNLYHLDEETGEWVYDRADINTVFGSELQPLSGAWSAYARVNSNGMMEMDFDNKTFAERWEDDSYSFLYRKDEDNTAQIYSLPGKMIVGNRYIDWSRCPRIALNMTSDGENEDHKVRFTLDASVKTHPELRAFQNVVWNYQGDMQKGDFRRDLVKKKVFYDLRITYDEVAQTFTIQLKDKDGKVTLEAVPEFNNGKMSDRALRAEYENRQGRYNLYLEQKATAFNKQVASNERKYNRQKEHSWFSVTTFMSEEERKMTKETWLEYYEVMRGNFSFMLDESDVDMMETYRQMEDSRRSALRRNRMNIRNSARSTRASLRRMIRTPFFGLINVDKRNGRLTPGEPVALPTILASQQTRDAALKIDAAFATKKNVRIDVQSAFVLAKGHNGVLRFDMEDKAKIMELVFNPMCETTIIAVDKKGKLSILKPKQVGDIECSYNKKVENLLEMKELDKQFKSIEDLRRLL